MITFLIQKCKIPKSLLSRIGMVLFAVFVLNASLVAQSVTIKGIVTDANNSEFLPGVNVLVEGTTIGVVTDLDGKYKITVPSANATLIFSYVGYITEKVLLSGKTEANVNLVPDIRTMDEVVVIGYGSSRKGDISGAIASINARDLKDIPVANAAEALTGRIAGVQITSADGSPDADIVIRVRGGGSITQDNSPLLLVDGFEVNNINDIAISDIESFVILKDASASAIYGARGANGVVLVTTKSAKIGRTTVNFNTYIKRNTFPIERKLDLLSPYEFVLSQYEIAKLRGITDLDAFNWRYGDYEDLDIYLNLKGTDWQDEMLGSVKQYSRYYNLSVNGGNEQTQTYLSFTQNKDDGLISTTNYKRSNLNFKLNHQIFKNLKMELNSRYSNTTINGAGTSGSSDLKISEIIQARPVNGLADYINLTIPDFDDQEYEDFVSGLVKPTEKVKQDYKQKKDKRFDMNAALNWKITPDLSLRTEFGVAYAFNDSKRYWGPLTGMAKRSGNFPVGQRSSSEESRYRLSNAINYTLTLYNHSFNILAGQELSNKTVSYKDIMANLFPIAISPDRMFSNFAKGTLMSQSASESPNERLESFFGRFNYSFKSKYIINLTFRADGSSLFAPGNQWGYFPAGSMAWRVSEEQFMKELTYITDFKLRASFGSAGNNRVGTDMWRYVYKISNSKTIGFGQGIFPYYVSSSYPVLANPDIKWESSIKKNIGVDFSLFNDRVSGTVDLYSEDGVDLIVEAPLNPETGFTKQLVNLGNSRNRGLEVSLNGTLVKTKDLIVSGTFNIGYNKFTIEKLNGKDKEIIVVSDWVASSDIKFSDDYRVYVGSEVGLMYGFVSEGFYSVDDFSGYDEGTGKYSLKPGIPTNDITNGIGLRPGVMKLKDLDGDGKITAADRKVIGHASAKHSGGFGLNATYKGFDLNAFFTWKYGFDVYNTNKMQFTAPYRNVNANMLNSVNYDNRFKYIGADGEIVTGLEELRELNKNATTWSPYSTASSVVVFSTAAVEDGSYLRLNLITLGYTLPKQLTSKAYIQQFRVYFTVNNAWLWTKYSGYDPDVSTTRSGGGYTALSPNIDISAYPRSRSFTLGINVTF